jgi:hypothetical protein
MDVHVPGGVTRGLRRAGIDVITAPGEEREMKGGSVNVDSEEYSWEIHRQPTWVTSGGPRLLGLALKVMPETPKTRKLILEFEISRGHRNMPQHQRFRVPDIRIAQCIREALAAGYEPESRGKAFRFEAGSTDPN